MRIGIDARLYGERGLGRYISQLLLHLEKSDHKNEYVVFLNKNGFEAYKPTAENFLKVHCDVPWYGVREQVHLSKILVTQKLDIMHFPHFDVPVFYRGKFVVTIHDFILYDFPTLRGTTRSALIFWAKYAVYRRIFRSTIERAQHIFVPSEYVRDRLFYHFPLVEASKVTVTREGADLDARLPSGSLASKSYVLAVGSAYPHKNLEALINAFLSLKRDDIQLFIAGKKDYFMQRLEQRSCLLRNSFCHSRPRSRSRVNSSGNPANFLRFLDPRFRGGDRKREFHNSLQRREGEVKFLGEVSDEELARLYAGAKAVAVVSCEEGFGLPGVEAMQYGTPVIASDRSSLPEVYKTRAYYVNPYDVGDMRRVMEEVIYQAHLLSSSGLTRGSSNSGNRGFPIKSGMTDRNSEDKDSHSWQILAEATRGVYESIA